MIIPHFLCSSSSVHSGRAYLQLSSRMFGPNLCCVAVCLHSAGFFYMFKRIKHFISPTFITPQQKSRTASILQVCSVMGMGWPAEEDPLQGPVISVLLWHLCSFQRPLCFQVKRFEVLYITRKYYHVCCLTSLVGL